MSEAEFEAWLAFDKINPLNDHRRVYLPAALIASSMSDDLQAKIDFLHPKPTQKQRHIRPVRVTRARKGKK